MSEHLASPQSEVEIAHTAAIIEDQLRTGFLRDIAAAKVDTLEENLAPGEIAEINLAQPRSGEALEPRWMLVDKAEAAEAVKTAIATNGERIISTVEALNLRKIVNGERQSETISSIHPGRAKFIGESGANKTSVVRRAVAVKAMHEVYGEDLSSRTLYQLGSDRVVSQTREVAKPDGSKETIANAEYKIVHDLAGDFLPTEGPFTEFEANLATALAEGYTVSSTYNTDEDETVTRKLELRHADLSFPKILLVQPAGRGLEGGFDALKENSAGGQFVVATNGQYREKDIYQAELWAKENGVEMLPAVALGDEPGDRFPFRNGEIIVPNRPVAAYINELVILYRLALKQLPDRHKNSEI